MRLYSYQYFIIYSFVVIKTKITIILYWKPWLTMNFCKRSVRIHHLYTAYASVVFFNKICPFLHLKAKNNYVGIISIKPMIETEGKTC